MSLHLGAKPGDVADTVLLPGDPLRAKFIADTLLEDVICYNEVRGMLGFTGNYKGKRVSVQGTGMGVPSLSIYVNELINDYGAKNLIRIGTCGGIREDIKVRDVILAMSASSDSQINRLIFNGMDFAPTANFDLLKKAYDAAVAKGLNVKVGNIFTTDRFYHEDPTYWKKWASYGVLAIEMESSGLYTLAAQHGVRALTILTVSDDIITGEHASAEERQTTFTSMIEVALAAI